MTDFSGVHDICHALYLNLQLVRRRIENYNKYKTKIQYHNNSTHIQYIEILKKQNTPTCLNDMYNCYNLNCNVDRSILFQSDIINEREIVKDLNKFCNHEEFSSKR
jgi:hypothetical protein